ncbi:hypothetical protein, partial [Klebsiella pneumoniae]|uniref:hypothetical protein n=1 Tax=Klebsiella pneumoniae TaxID=573 RepID=UPI003AEF5606
MTQSQDIFGTVTINGGRLRMGANATLGQYAVVVLNGGIFDPGAQTVTVNGSLQGAGQIFVGS